MNYGIPYMGSKSKICADVCRLFPKADHFYDLFGGGFSITHYMLMHRKRDFKEFHFNEIRPGICELIQKAIQGEYSYEKFKMPWVSREQFFKLKDIDPFIKIIWSFGNSGKTYLFGPDIELYKKSMHYAVVFNQFDETAKKVLGMEKFRDSYSITDRRLFLRSRVKFLNPNKTDGEIRYLQQLQQLERLEQLQQLQRLQRLSFYNSSYEKISIKENSIVYCDIPYQGTSEYDKNKSFNHAQFFDWASAQSNPVFISEYQVTDSRFKCIFAQNKRSMLNQDSSRTLIKSEKVYVNRAGYELIQSTHKSR